MAILHIPIENLTFRQELPPMPPAGGDFPPIHIEVNPVKLLERALRKHNPGCTITHPEQIDTGLSPERRKKMERAWQTGGVLPDLEEKHTDAKIMIVARAGRLVIDKTLIADCPGLMLTPILFARWRKNSYLTEHDADHIVIADEPTSQERAHYERWAHGDDNGMSLVVQRRYSGAWG